MKRSIKVLLTYLVVANLWTSCIGGAVISNDFEYKKVEACEKINDSSNEPNIKQVLSFIPQLVKNNDIKYINDRERNCNCEYVFKIDAFYKHDSDMIKAVKSVWNIEDDDYIAVVGRDKNQDPATAFECEKITYFIGVSTGNIILIPFQGGMEAYSIKNNSILKTYSDVTQDSSYKWR